MRVSVSNEKSSDAWSTNTDCIQRVNFQRVQTAEVGFVRVSVGRRNGLWAHGRKRDYKHVREGPKGGGSLKQRGLESGLAARRRTHIWMSVGGAFCLSRTEAPLSEQTGRVGMGKVVAEVGCLVNISVRTVAMEWVRNIVAVLVDLGAVRAGVTRLVSRVYGVTRALFGKGGSQK